MMQQKKTKCHFAKVTLREIEVITYQGKVWVPKNCREDLMEWYYKNLQHCREEIMARTIRTNFRWPGWMTQEYKITGQKAYGKVPLYKGKEDIKP
eukprot:14931077-Ditylum_brightwellii.AAC.2